jgi:hypothetical protein
LLAILILFFSSRCRCRAAAIASDVVLACVCSDFSCRAEKRTWLQDSMLQLLRQTFDVNRLTSNVCKDLRIVEIKPESTAGGLLARLLYSACREQTHNFHV